MTVDDMSSKWLTRAYDRKFITGCMLCDVVGQDITGYILQILSKLLIRERDAILLRLTYVCTEYYLNITEKVACHILEHIDWTDSMKSSPLSRIKMVNPEFLLLILQQNRETVSDVNCPYCYKIKNVIHYHGIAYDILIRNDKYQCHSLFGALSQAILSSISIGWSAVLIEATRCVVY